MENPYQGQLNYSHNSEDEGQTHQRKPHKGYQGTPGEKESYEHQHHQRNSNEGSANVYTESHQGTQEDEESQDLRRKGELNNAIFIKLQEISRYNVEIGNYEEGLVNYDRCIEHLLRTLPEGPSSAIFQEFLYTTVKSLNEIALKLLQEGKLKDSLLLLERCRKMTHPNSFGSYPTLRSLTYNHLGCCYRRIGKLDKALYYLEKAWEFIQGIEKVDTSGITHINLCAVLSQLGDHRKALDHAKMAVSDCAYDLIEATKKNSIEDNHNDVNKKATMLAIAYHNLATEEEACKNPEAALQAYLRAFNLISEHNHPQHELCTKFGRAYEEARGRLVKPGQRRTMSPGSQQRRYGKSPPPNITVKRPPSLNTANKAAKAYLQNNKVVIPRRKVPPMNQTRPMTSHGVSPNANNPLNNQKLYVPMASLPQKRNERPVTAHPQSRTQHYQIQGINETPPQNQNGRPGTGTGTGKRGNREEEPNRPSESELGSDVERFGLDEEDIEQADLKSNRLAFLQSLNQYNTQSNVSKGSDVAQREEIPSKASSKKRGNQQQEADPAKVHAATLKLQSFCRGHQARQEVARVMAEVPQPVFLILIAETMKGNLENGPMTKETLYYFLMMYELHSQIIHIHIKNLENKRFHKALVEYQVVNRTSKEAIIDELREACEKLIQHLEIHHDQIVFRDELGAEEAIPEDVYMMGQDMARRDPENVITEITERTDERTDESEGKIAGSRQEEDVNSDGNLRFSHNEEKPEEEVVDEIAEEDNKYAEEVFEEEKPKQSAREVPQEEDINFDEEDQIEVDEEEDKTHQPIVDTNEVAGLVGLSLLGGAKKDKKTEESILRIQRNVRGKLARDKYKLFKNKKFKVVFSRCLNVQGNILGFRLVEGPSFHDQYGLFCYDFTKSKQFEAIELPKHLVDLPNLTVQELRAMLNIDLLALRVHIKPEVKDKKPTPHHHHHHEEVLKEKSEPASASSRKQPPQEMASASEIKSSRREHHDHDEEMLASVPLHFGKEKIDSTIHYNKKAEKILVRHGSGKKLEIPVSELEIDTEFSKPHFVNNMDIILLSRLSYKNGALTYDKSPHAQIPPPKQEPHQKEEALPDLEDPEVLQATSTIQKAYRKKQNQAKEQPKEQKPQPKKTEDIKHHEEPKHKEKEETKPEPKEADDTKHHEKPHEEEIIEERGSHQKKLTVPNNRYSQKALEEPEVSSPGLKDSAARFDSNRSANLFVNQESEELFNSGKNDQIRSINVDAPHELGHFRGEQIEEGTQSKPQKTTKKDDSLPDLNDPEVQGATLKIQNAYKKKQAKGSEKKKEEVVVEQPKEVKPSKKEEEEEEELPNLEDPDVQNASLKIQKAYLKKKDRQNKKEQEVPKPKEEKLPTPKKQKEEEEEELPNLEDPDVQNASLKIQKAYLKKKDRQNKKAQEEEKPKEQEKPKQPEEIKPSKKEEEEEEMPNLEDPDVQNASLKIQKAYLKKKDRQNKKAQEVPQPKEEKLPTPKKQKEEEEEELPNLEDPDVQNASLKIQKAYLKKKDRQNKKAQEEEKPKELEKPKQPEEIKPPKKEEEEEELPNLEDPDVQNASLKIQQAYLKKKDRQNRKTQEQEKPKEQPKEQEKPKDIKLPHKKEEEEEMPNLEDPDVQNASLKIQQAYLKKKNNKKAAAAPQKEEIIVKKPAVPEKKEEDAYEDEFEKESPSPVKEQKQEAKQQPKPMHHAEPEFGLKEVGDEFDVFDKEEKKQAEALKRPGTAKVEKQTTKEVKPQDTDEDFEPLDEDF